MSAVELAPALLALVAAASLTGVELCVAAFFHPVIDRLGSRASRTAHSLGARRLGAVMPFWYALAALTAIPAAWGAASADDAPAAGTWLWVAAGAGLVLVIVFSIVVLVPINNRIAGASDGSAAQASSGTDESARGADIARWDRLHRCRTAALAVIVAVEVAAALA